MAHLLKKFGESALKPRLVNSVWRKPNISGRVAAVLKKSFLLKGQCATGPCSFLLLSRSSRVGRDCMLCSDLQRSGAGKGVGAHLVCGREWPYEAPEKPHAVLLPATLSGRKGSVCSPAARQGVAVRGAGEAAARHQAARRVWPVQEAQGAQAREGQAAAVHSPVF